MARSTSHMLSGSATGGSWSCPRTTTPCRGPCSTMAKTLAAAHLEQTAFACLAYVGRLRGQHVGQRPTTLDGDRDAVDEARQRTQRGSLRDAVQRLEEAGSRPRVGESAA